MPVSSFRVKAASSMLPPLTTSTGDQDVVGNEDGDLLAVHGVDGADALQADAGLFLVELGALKVGLVGGLVHIGGDCIPVRELVLPLLHIGVLRREDHIGGTKEGVRPGGVDQHVVSRGGMEIDLGACGAADPVLLLGLHALDIVQIVDIVDQTLGVLGDGQHPLALFLPDHLAAAALADTLHHLFVGQDALAAGAPVHGHGGLVGQALFEHLQEDPLGPLVVLGIGGVDYTVPVKAVAQHLQLTGEVLNVLAGDDGGMDVVLDGKVLRRQAEGVGWPT